MKNTNTAITDTTLVSTPVPTNTTIPTNNNSLFINAPEICLQMGISKTYAYRIIKQLNNELQSKGFIVIQGKTSRKYFYERIYGMVS